MGDELLLLVGVRVIVIAGPSRPTELRCSLGMLLPCTEEEEPIAQPLCQPPPQVRAPLQLLLHPHGKHQATRPSSKAQALLLDLPGAGLARDCRRTGR